MSTRRIAVIGGGPAGLFAARLVKRADPAAEVIVHERNGLNTSTFGFGVGLTESTMSKVAAADADVADRIRAAGYAGHNLELHKPDGGGTQRVLLHGARNLAIGRAELLDVLRAAAIEAGVDYRAGSKVDLANIDADVVIAADGVRSAVRAKLSTELGVHETLGRGRYMWCGVDFAVDSAFFTARTGDDGGFFVAHAYPYRADRSTFLIEADDTTWRAAGLDVHDARTGPGQTDVGSIAVLEDVFADDLRGRRLLTNRTRWARFSTLGLDTWSNGNVVLVGDAAHTAHYTLGSGTKLALEDAIALSDALAGHAVIAEAFAHYERHRRPAIDRFKHLAGRSQRWWETYRMRVTAPAERVALSYMTRSGNLGIVDYAHDHPDVVGAALKLLGTEPPRDPDLMQDWVLAGRVTTPAELQHDSELVAQIVWSETDPWSESADVVVNGLRTRHPGAVTYLVGANDEAAVGGRLDIAERIKLETSRRVVVALPETARAQGAAAIATGRCDALVMRE
ncbi:MAG: FAD-dependent monooxygenase [Mycobacterium sp.]